MPRRGKGGGGPPPEEEPVNQSPDGRFSESGQRRPPQDPNPDSIEKGDRGDYAHNEDSTYPGPSMPDDLFYPNLTHDDILTSVSDFNAPKIDVSAPRPQALFDIDPLANVPDGGGLLAPTHLEALQSRLQTSNGSSVIMDDVENPDEIVGSCYDQGFEKGNVAGTRRRRTWSAPPAVVQADITDLDDPEQAKEVSDKELADSKIMLTDNALSELAPGCSGSSSSPINSAAEVLLKRYNSFEVD
jgi:hypothetical protein